jgi:hypothetical protein
MLRRVGRRGLCQQLLDRPLDLEPERLGVHVACLGRLAGDVLRRIGAAPADDLTGGAPDVGRPGEPDP